MKTAQNRVKVSESISEKALINCGHDSSRSSFPATAKAAETQHLLAGRLTLDRSVQSHSSRSHHPRQGQRGDADGPHEQVPPRVGVETAVGGVEGVVVN